MGASEKSNVVTINFTGDVRDLNKAFKDVNAGLKTVETQAGGLGKSISSGFKGMEGLATGSFQSISSNFMSLVTNPITLGVAGIGAAVIAAFNFTKIGEENEKINKNFSMFATQAGFNAEVLKDKISGIADGFVDMEDVLPKAQEGIIALGKNAEKLPEIFELARNIGVKTGRDINEVFGQLTMGIANGNEKMLRNNMVRIDSKKAEEAYAQSLGISVDRLTDAEKQQARLNAVLAQGKTNFGSLGEEAAPIEGGIRKLKLAFDDVKDAIAAIMNSKLGEFFAGVVSTAASGIKGLADSIKLMSGDLGTSGEQIARLEKHIAGLQKVQEGFFANPTMHEAYQKQIDESIAKVEKLKAAQAKQPETVLAPGQTTVGQDGAASRREESDAVLAIEQQERATIEQMEVEHQAAMAQIALDNDATLAERQELLLQNQILKNNQIYEAELEKNRLIKDAQQRAAADDLANAKFIAANQKAVDEKALKDKQAMADMDKAIKQASFQAASNFMQAGLTLAKEGSAEQKALLIGQAIMNTYLGATAALAPPPSGLGPLFGIPLAASTIAMGLANVAKITGANSGALVTGGTMGVDTEPFLLSKGEIVAPAKSFDEVIEGTARQRGFVKGNEGSDDSQLLQAISERLSQPTVMIQAGYVSDEENVINKIVEKIREAVQFRDAKLT